MKSVALHNLGCKVNSYEMDVMQQMLQEKGYCIVPFDDVADIYIVNTCTVTNIADRKSRQMLHRAKQKNPDSVVVAVGCYVQTGKEQVELDESIDLAVGNNRKKHLVEILETFLKQKEAKTDYDFGCSEAGEDSGCGGAAGGGAGRAETWDTGKTLNRTTIVDMDHTYDYEEMTLKQTGEHTRAYIKIQDGCNQFCSYCIIPFARGRVRSRRAEDIIKEIQGLAESGFQEVVITGIHISSYGIDFVQADWEQGRSVEAVREEGRHDYSGSSKLVDLVERIHDVEGIKRIRLGSLEPRVITRETAGRLAALPKVCPHFHLSLQSGCDETLKRMNRRYTSREYYQSVEVLREFYREPAVTTDVIVGFPGETKEEFEETREFLEKVVFYEMHIFKFSKRKGTRAADMSGQITDAVKAARSNELLEMERVQSKEFRRNYIGRETEVLFEESKLMNGKRYQIGHTADYVKVALETDENLSNCMKIVKIVGFLTDEVLNSIS